MNNGFNAWISKPFRIETLEDLLEAFLPEHKSAGKRGGGC